ncbi:hypothetical protein Pa4123_89390 [Phytohabitans aurantiacus]|uniref:Uncharacterized protein n=2 Tax=Phytohabitans aurantiacus TaxID=3016789 RepID=A0ABQ5RA72_9ACTN|nr:hypothetical protein Pa4123_89390 [Phytohabitans aurantiacus]
MEVTVEVNWVTGDQAEDLAHRQWLVIKEVLQWTIDHPHPGQEAAKPATGLSNEQ